MRRDVQRFVAVTVAGAAVAVLAGPRGPLGGFWRPAPEAPQVGGALLVGFIGENMVENVAFGAGVAVLLLGRRWFGARIDAAAGVTAAWLATAWLLVSWWPHAALHMHIGMRPEALLAVEWVFHGGSIAAVGVLVWALSGVLALRPVA